MNLNDYIKNVQDISKKYQLPPQLIIDLVDAQEVKRAYRNQEADVDKSIDTLKRYLRIKGDK